MNTPATPTTSASPEANWLPQARGSLAMPPPEMICWLRDSGSLTSRLRRACLGRFSVRVLRQGRGRALPSEARLLGMGRGEGAVLREVQLLCDGECWVFARTVIPARSVRGAMHRLLGLGTRPLGEVLFTDRRVRRGEVQAARIRPGHALFGHAVAHLPVRPGELWGRRAVFWLEGRPLLVNELFLPGVPACPARHTRVRRS